MPKRKRNNVPHGQGEAIGETTDQTSSGPQAGGSRTDVRPHDQEPSVESRDPDAPGARTPPGPYSYTAEKRRRDASPDNRQTKERKTKNHGANNGRKPRTDPLFGQTNALPDEHEADADDEDDDSAVAYLRSVR